MTISSSHGLRKGLAGITNSLVRKPRKLKHNRFDIERIKLTRNINKYV